MRPWWSLTSKAGAAVPTSSMVGILPVSFLNAYWNVRNTCACYPAPMSETTLRVGGACEAGDLELTYADCEAAAEEHKIPDLGSVLPDRQGTAIRFRALIERARPHADVAFVNVASSDGSFTASLPVEELAEKGIVLYALDDEPLPETYGGPFRLFLADSEDCSVNVKFLGSVEFAASKGSHTARCSD